VVFLEEGRYEKIVRAPYILCTYAFQGAYEASEVYADAAGLVETPNPPEEHEGGRAFDRRRAVWE
jgi:hypothetical protein